MTETPAVTIEAPADWGAAIDGHEPRWPLTSHKNRQLSVALAYLVDRVQAGTVTEPGEDTPGTRGHAAVILLAGSDAPRSERNFGIRTRPHGEACAAAFAEPDHDGCECWCHVPVLDPTAVVAKRGRTRKAQPEAVQDDAGGAA